MTIQWRFADAEPWYLRIDNGSTAAEPGLSNAPDLTLETSWKDWVAVSTGDESARRALLQRRIRPRGSLRNLVRMGRLFPGRPSRLA